MLERYSPIVQTLLGTGLTWAVTALGAAFCVFQSPRSNKQNQGYVLDGSLGFSAGVMLAASFWSLLDPAIAMSKNELQLGVLSVLPAALGLVFGAAFVCLTSHFLPAEWFEPVHNKTLNNEEPEMTVKATSASTSISATEEHSNLTALRMRKLPGSSTVIKVPTINPVGGPTKSPSRTDYIVTRRLWLLIIAVTVHNIPEGLAVGISFGGIGQHAESTFADARNLAIGIAIQNFPEGLSVSLPLRAAGYGFWKSLWFGQLSGLVEPIAGLIGCLAVQLVRKLQPYALGFAAGAMLFVVFDDVIPEAQTRQNGRLASVAAIIGFIVMMCLDVVTGGTGS